MICEHGAEAPDEMGDFHTVLMRIPTCCLRAILAKLEADPDPASAGAARRVRGELAVR